MRATKTVKSLVIPKLRSFRGKLANWAHLGDYISTNLWVVGLFYFQSKYPRRWKALCRLFEV